jgi:hypothetical protein
MKVPGALPGSISGRNDRPVEASGMLGEWPQCGMEFQVEESDRLFLGF